MRKYTLEIIVFICGMAVMVFELVGARVLAAFMGTSIIVWSGLIGVMLLALALGYWWGGKAADRRPDFKSFSAVIFIAAVFMGLTGIFKLPVLNFITKIIKDIRFGTVLASLVLFAPASFFLAAISPYAARLKLANLKQSGQTVGNLYAMSTAGSIFGTFLTGFVLVLYVGDTRIILLLSVLLFLCSLLAFSKKWMKAKVLLVVLLFAGQFGAAHLDKFFLPKNTVAVLNSQYGNIYISKQVLNYSDGTARPIVALSTDVNTVQSAMYTDRDNDLVIPYARVFRLAAHFNPGIKNALIIGGGAYSVPRDFIKRNSQAHIDVVEIDPKVTLAAKEYFSLTPDPRITTYNEDGRVFLNQNQKKYDVVFMDAYKTDIMPFQLATVETAQKIYQSLNSNGVVMVNLMSSIQGDHGKFLRAEYATYKKVFPQVYVFRVLYAEGDKDQNLIIVGLKSDTPPSFTDSNPELNNYLSHVWTQPIANDMPVLTDDFAPVDQYLLPVYEQSGPPSTN
jgi:spermidine synthase